MAERPARVDDGAGRAVAPLPRPHPDLTTQVLDRMPAAFYLVDRQWRFRYVNTMAERLFGRPRTELLGRSLWRTFPGMVGTAFEAACRAAVDSGGPVAFESASPGPDDGWFEVRAWPEPDGLAVYLLDVTDRRQAEDAARRAAARTSLLARLSTELSGARDGESALARLARLVVPTLTDACIVTVVDRDGHARDIGSWHVDPARRELLERYTEVRLESLPLTSPVARALTTGTPLSESIEAVLALMAPGPAAELLQALRPESVVVLPLPAEARTVGVLTLYLDAGRTLSGEDLETAREVAGQAGRVVERVNRQSQQTQLTEALQRSLLTDPPHLPGADVAVRYVPAAEAARVGGDWYDAFLLPDGTPVVVIGDVTGHDTAAAAAMAQLRGLLRGVAHAGGGGPAEVLTCFDEAVVAMHPDTLATVALARIERPGGASVRLRWASAGHPPPVLVEASGHVRLLGHVTGELLVGLDTSARRTESTVDLGVGDTVLLYTDGLVERRDASLDDGMARLVTALEDLRGQPLDTLCDAVLERMLQGTPQDDVALLAVRIGETDVPAEHRPADGR